MAAKFVDKEQLIESVRKLPCLYDTSMKGYKDEMVRENAWKRVCEDIFQKAYHNDKALCEDLNLIKKLFKSLRDRYMKVRREYKPSGRAGGASIEPSWPYFKQLEYLSPFTKNRKTKGIFLVDIKPDEGHQLETMNEAEFLNSIHESESILENEMQDTLDGIEIEKEDAVEPPSPLSESAVPKKATRSNKEKDLGETQYLMEVLQGTNEFISSVSRKGELDEDDLFGQSIAMKLTKLSEYKKSLAKMKIQQAMHEVRFSSEPNLI